MTIMSIQLWLIDCRVVALRFFVHIPIFFFFLLFDSYISLTSKKCELNLQNMLILLKWYVINLQE